MSTTTANAVLPKTGKVTAPSWLYAIVLLVFLAALNPRGYVGGGNDDWYYVEAARCGMTHGWCLPQTHWAARFPVVVPMTGIFDLFGVSTLSVGMVTALYACAAVLLLALNVERRWGRNPAIMAAMALVLTPAFSLNVLEPQADIAELAWTLAALLAGQIAIERRDARAAALSGAALALAIMTRMSALAFLPIACLGFLFAPADRRRLAIPMGLALVAALAAEAAGYWIVTGNPAYGWLLSLHHTTIASTELDPNVDLSRSALLNLDFIRGWKRSMGIHVHWSVDPLLNLLADPRSGLTLIGAAALALLRRRDWRTNNWIKVIAAAAAIHFLLLTYVLAIDPKPRMFLFEYAVAATVTGVFGTAAWRGGVRAIVVVLFVLMVGRAMLLVSDRVDTRSAQSMAEQWVAAAPGKVTVDDWTRRTLALSSTIYATRQEQIGTTDPVLALTTGECVHAATLKGPAWRIIRERRFASADPAPIAWLRQRSILFGPRAVPSLCLLGR